MKSKLIIMLDLSYMCYNISVHMYLFEKLQIIICICLPMCIIVYVLMYMCVCMHMCMYVSIHMCICVQMFVYHHIDIYAVHIPCIYEEKISMHVCIC